MLVVALIFTPRFRSIRAIGDALSNRGHGEPEFRGARASDGLPAAQYINDRR